MQGPGKFVLTVGALLFIAPACGAAQNVDCRSCHAPGNVHGARDFSLYYERRVRHHPDRIKYPAVPTATPGFKTPDGHSPGVQFFDLNGNGQPDANEIQLFGESGAFMLECASCHREHGVSPPSDKLYLRVNNAGSALCNICHKL